MSVQFILVRVNTVHLRSGQMIEFSRFSGHVFRTMDRSNFF
jgi:hypothetical protein